MWHLCLTHESVSTVYLVFRKPDTMSSLTGWLPVPSSADSLTTLLPVLFHCQPHPTTSCSVCLFSLPPIHFYKSFYSVSYCSCMAKLSQVYGSLFTLTLPYIHQNFSEPVRLSTCYSRWVCPLVRGWFLPVSSPSIIVPFQIQPSLESNRIFSLVSDLEAVAAWGIQDSVQFSSRKTWSLFL